jgi:hypothetical protein
MLSNERCELYCHVHYATDTHLIEFLDEKRAHAENLSKCLQLYEEISAGGKRRRTRTLHKTIVESEKRRGRKQELRFPKGTLQEFW